MIQGGDFIKVQNIIKVIFVYILGRWNWMYEYLWRKI